MASCRLELPVLFAQHVEVVARRANPAALRQIRAGREHEHEQNDNHCERGERELGAAAELHALAFPGNARAPRYSAASPRSCSMRSSWLYFATQIGRASCRERG